MLIVLKVIYFMATSTPPRCRVPATGKIQFSNTADLELQCRSYTALLDTPTVHTIGKISIKYFRNIHTTGYSKLQYYIKYSYTQTVHCLELRVFNLKPTLV
jgi:hypothetical protein